MNTLPEQQRPLARDEVRLQSPRHVRSAKQSLSWDCMERTYHLQSTTLEEVMRVTQREDQWMRVAEREQVIAREFREVLQTGRVLIVEDDLLAKHRMRLDELGFEEGKHFIAVTNLEDAHTALAGVSVALLVTDMDFPRTQLDLERLQALSLEEFDSREGLIVRNAGMELADEATKYGVPVVASTSREDCEISNISKGNYSVEDLETMLRALRTGQLSSPQQ